MRPIDRGATPPEVLTDYAQAAPYLKERLGRYCSYCERHFPASLAVEHISPKSLEPSERLSWTNFLLACAPCNSSKGVKPYVAGRSLWPDSDDTFNALIYREDGAIKAKSQEATALLALVGLDQSPRADQGTRWKDRQEAWELALEAQRNIAANPSTKTFALKAVLKCGHWSIWMTVFAGDADMQSRLIDAFPGTAKARLAGAIGGAIG
jgi:hypothetical protein